MHLFRWFVGLVGLLAFCLLFGCVALAGVWVCCGWAGGWFVLYCGCGLGWFGCLGLCLLVVCCGWVVLVGGLFLRLVCCLGFCCRWQWLRCSGGLLGLVMHGLVVAVCGLFPSCFDLWVGVDYDLVSIAGCGFLSSSTLFLMGFGLIW